ncbi:MAG: triphosphoribosyl-dephospho-CoA synthase [Bacilli bacterium]|nr:triphosphoribosyl-dephospho-CoA synthase [Bacilli bacterium]
MIHFDKILRSREIGFEKIKKLKMDFKSVITVKSNIPGEEKQHYIAYLLVNRFIHLIPKEYFIYKEYSDGYDGPSFILGSNLDPKYLKTQLIKMENTQALGRFVDLDVFDGESFLTRGDLRQCYLCNKAAFVCAKEHNHSSEELIQYVTKSVITIFESELSELIDESILKELTLHPKFGLVTPYSNGSHPDMNYDLMLTAKDAILPFFIEMFEVGLTESDYENIFNHIRKIGLKAERAMNQATGNINAYKGLIFNLGILVTAFGNALQHNSGVESVYQISKKIATYALVDFARSDLGTFGLKSFQRYQIKGARGEAVSGFLTVQKMMKYIGNHKESNDHVKLMYLIAHCEDTVLLKRCGSKEKYLEVKQMFLDRIQGKYSDIESLNQYCLKNNLSFGGSADLLILVFFIEKLRHLIW